MPRKIKNEAILLAYLEAKDRKQAQKYVYKYTDCGAWIEFEPDGIKLGSIVEGADFGTWIYPLKYPFTKDDYNARIAAIEEEADLIWDWANKDENEGLDAPDFTAPYDTDGRSS